MSTSRRKTFDSFDQLIRKNLSSFGVSPDRSTFRKAVDELKQGGEKRYWLQGAARKKHWDSARTAGYLAGYVEFAGPKLPGKGIEVIEGFVRLDKGVMCSLLVGKCVSFSRGDFLLTKKGQALIAPFVRLRSNGSVRQ
jgi:hypothetical protein